MGEPVVLLDRGSLGREQVTDFVCRFETDLSQSVSPVEICFTNPKRLNDIQATLKPDESRCGTLGHRKNQWLEKLS
jgi:hypothetical protein